jgi:hypothetical protein
MQKSLLTAPLIAVCFLMASHALTAQEVVHALTGTVNNIDSTAKVITVTTDDGSVGTFDESAAPHAWGKLDKSLRIDAVAAGEFNQTGARVVVYYFGWGEPRTAVGFRTIAPGTVTRTDGIVVKLEKGEHLLTVKEQSGKVDSFKITPDAVAETGVGAVDGFKFDPARGQRVRVTSTLTNGSEVAVFINAAFIN